MSQKAALLVFTAEWRQCRQSRTKLTVDPTDVVRVGRESRDGSRREHNIVDGI